MYNEELKTKFIRDYTKSISTANACAATFNATERYEALYETDIYAIDEQRLQAIIEDVVGLRARSKWLRLIIIKDYIKWCIATGIPDTCDAIFKINTVGLEKLRQQTVSSPAHLESYLNKICEPVDEKTTDNILRCYYWLAYAGIKEEDILNIKCDAVDFTKMVVKYNDSEVPIYREAVQAFKNCVELNQFVYKHPLYSSLIWKDRVPGDTVVRGVRALPSLKSIRVELSRRSKNKREENQTDLKLSYYRVWISGVFYRIYENELMGIKPDFKDIVSRSVETRTYKLDSGRNTIEHKKRQLAKDYLEDYQRWKLAFKI